MPGDYYYDATKGAEALGSALSGVGGLEGYRAQMLQKMADQAAMERLLKQNELKQQAEAAAEEQRQQKMAALMRLAHGSTAGRSPGMDPEQYGPDSPTPGGQINPYEMSAAYANLDPSAGASIFSNAYNQQLGTGLIDNPKYNQWADLQGARAFQALQAGNNSAASANRTSQMTPFQVQSAQSDADIKGITAREKANELLRKGQQVPLDELPSDQEGPVRSTTVGDMEANAKFQKVLADTERAKAAAAKALREPPVKPPPTSVNQKFYFEMRNKLLTEIIKEQGEPKKKKAVQANLKALQKIDQHAVMLSDPTDEDSDLVLSPQAFQVGEFDITEPGKPEASGPKKTLGDF